MIPKIIAILKKLHHSVHFQKDHQELYSKKKTLLAHKQTHSLNGKGLFPLNN